MLAAVTCTKGQRKSDVHVPEAVSGRESALVDTGFSMQGTFSPDGSKMLFVSRDRKSHPHFQVYEKDLKSGEETRITFQNGDTYWPTYHPKEPLIVYSSSTDELKENPPLLQYAPETQTLPENFRMPLEIYSHSLRDYQIQRLTERMGFDGEARFSPDGSGLTWTRARGKNVEVLSLKLSAKTPQALKGLGPNPSQYTSSKDGKWRAWIDSDESFGVGKLMVQSGKKPASELAIDMVVPKVDLAFSPDSKYILWSQFNTATKNYQVWAAELESLCARRLSENGDGDGDRRYPALNPAMKVLAYTSVQKKRSRIMQLAWVPPTAPCAPSP